MSAPVSDFLPDRDLLYEEMRAESARVREAHRAYTEALVASLNCQSRQLEEELRTVTTELDTVENDMRIYLRRPNRPLDLVIGVDLGIGPADDTIFGEVDWTLDTFLAKVSRIGELRARRRRILEHLTTLDEERDAQNLQFFKKLAKCHADVLDRYLAMRTH